MTDIGSQNGDESLLMAMVSGATIREAGDRAGLSERTVYRRLADPDFQARLVCARRACLERGIDALAGAFVSSLGTLKTLRDTAKSEHVRLQAALALIDRYLKVQEILVIQARQDALDARLRELAEQQMRGPSKEDEERIVELVRRLDSGGRCGRAPVNGTLAVSDPPPFVATENAVERATEDRPELAPLWLQ